MRAGLTGLFYASRYDWAVTDQLMLRTFNSMVRQIGDCELHIDEETLPEIFYVISARGDRIEGRYVSTAINQVNQVELKVNCGLIPKES